MTTHGWPATVCSQTLSGVTTPRGRRFALQSHTPAHDAVARVADSRLVAVGRQDESPGRQACGRRDAKRTLRIVCSRAVPPVPDDRSTRGDRASKPSACRICLASSAAWDRPPLRECVRVEVRHVVAALPAPYADQPRW